MPTLSSRAITTVALFSLSLCGLGECEIVASKVEILAEASCDSSTGGKIKGTFRRYEFDNDPAKSDEVRPFLLAVETTDELHGRTARLWQLRTFATEGGGSRQDWSGALLCGAAKGEFLFVVMSKAGYKIRLKIYAVGEELRRKALEDSGEVPAGLLEPSAEGGEELGSIEATLPSEACAPNRIRATRNDGYLSLITDYSYKTYECHDYWLAFDLAKKRFTGRPLEWKKPVAQRLIPWKR